jgi:hypothetical protein
MTTYHMTRRSSNVKTGSIPVTTSSADTCPSACPFQDNGCYAKAGKLKLHWDSVTRGEKRAVDIFDLCDSIASLPKGQLWRHNQAGDLPGNDNEIDALPLADIVEANIGKRGYTYTHKPIQGKPWSRNRNIVRLANKAGFTINLSSNNLKHADDLLELNIAPVVTILPNDSPKVTRTPKGVKVLTCPAQTSDAVTCASCGLCALADRKFVIGFLAHGNGSRKLLHVSNNFNSEVNNV